MTSMNRRHLLLGTAGAVLWAALPAVVRARARKPATTGASGNVPPGPPVARVAPVTDTYFGEQVTDPYRWMENDQDPDWLPYLRAENAYTRQILDALPQRATFLRRIGQLSGDTAATRDIQQAGARLFYEQRPLGADNFKLFVREGGQARVLVDPVLLSAGGPGHVSLDWWRASPDGQHLVYGLSRDGSEDSTAHVLAVDGGRDLPERIPNTQGAIARWAPDATGFYYTQLTHPVNTPERFLDARVCYHRLGTDPATDPVLMQRGRDPRISFERIQGPFVLTFAGADRVVLGLRDVRPESRFYTAPATAVLAGKATWTEVATFDNEVTGVELIGEQLYLLVNQGTPRGRLVRTSAAAPDLATATVVVPQGPMVIQEMARARDGLYLKLIDGGISRLRKVSASGAVTDVPLPFDGTIGGLFADPAQDGVLILLSGWLSPQGVYRVAADGTVTDTGLTPKPAIDVSAYATTRGFATAADGTRIPYHLVHRQDVKCDGTHPTYISAYGSYGAAAYTPAFNARALALIDAGFVVGYAGVRGGGEYGREWHQAGQHANKPNTWRDLIAVCETLIHEGWTAPRHLAINGRSAGGITVGRAMTERPELFAAVIDGVGWSNPLRYVVEQNGFGEEPEWGAIRDPEGYRWLKAIDSYQAVRDGVKYPAVLLTTGVTDPRVAPFHVAKMTARLQAATTSGKPVLLRVDFDAGHGVGSTRAQQDAEAADTYAFLAWRTG